MSVIGDNASTIVGSGSMVFYVPATPPTNFSVTAVTTTTATIGFTAPPESEHITAYKAYVNGYLIGTFSGTNSIKVTGLTLNTTYSLTVQSVSPYGTSDISIPVTFTTALVDYATITRFAGQYDVAGYTGDGGPATSAKLSRPSQMAYDPSGYLYVTDYENNAIRKINLTTNVITTLIGNGTSSSTGDNGPAASATTKNPFGIILDNSKNIYFTEIQTNKLRKIDPSTGNVSLVTSGISPNNWIAALAYDNSGNMLIGGMENLYKLSKDTNGVISSSSVKTTYSTPGIGCLNVYCDPTGNIWVSNPQDNTNMARYSSNGTLLFQYSTSSPFCVKHKISAGAYFNIAPVYMEPNGTLFAIDYGYNRLFKITPGTDGKYGFTASASNTFTSTVVMANSGQGALYDVSMHSPFQFALAGNDAFISQDGGHIINKVANFSVLL